MAVTATLELLVGVWIDLTPDIIRDPVRWRRGIFGRGPLDRLAGPGTLSFTLDNTDQNDAGSAGRYSPGHANCLAGWQHGATVRLHLTDGINSRYIFRGRLASILPDPAVTGLRAVTCVANDWMAEFADAEASNLALRTNVRADELLQDLIDVVDVPPVVTDLDQGQDQYPFAFDDLGEAPRATQVAQDVLQSDLGFLVVRGDATGGETLRFINFQSRALGVPVAAFSTLDFHPQADAFRVPSTIAHVFNEIEALTVPRRVGATLEVLVSLDGPIEVGAGETETIFVDYRDPANEAEYVGGSNMEQPAANTDWTANAAEDGSGANLTANFDVTASHLGSRVILELTNNSGSTGYVRGPGGAEGLQVRGIALRRYRSVSTFGTNETSRSMFGRRPLPTALVMPYQNDRAVAKVAVDYLAFVHGGLDNTPERVQLATDADDALQAHGILRDVGDVITVDEAQTASDHVRAFINGLEQELTLDGRLYTWWTLAPRQVEDELQADGVVVADVLAGVSAAPETRIGFLALGFGEIG
jgi:hypothetical protein